MYDINMNKIKQIERGLKDYNYLKDIPADFVDILTEINKNFFEKYTHSYEDISDYQNKLSRFYNEFLLANKPSKMIYVNE